MAYELDHQYGNEYRTSTIYGDKQRKFIAISSHTIQNRSRDRVWFFWKRQQPKQANPCKTESWSKRTCREIRYATTVQAETTIDTHHNPCRRRIKESRRRVDRVGAEVAASKNGRSHLGFLNQTTQTTSSGCWKQTAQTTSDVEDVGEQEQPPQNHRHWNHREIRRGVVRMATAAHRTTIYNSYIREKNGKRR